MRRYPSSPSSVSFSFGPGPVTPVIKILIWTNVAFFVLAWVLPAIRLYLGLMPDAVFGRFFLWQPATYLFLHAGFFHIIFNMLALWMFGVELERLWGARFFLKYYFVTGVGAGLTTLAVALLPGELGASVRYSVTVGASGAVYGLLLAYALYFPNRPIYLYLLFPIPAKYFVLILGAIAFFLSISDTVGGVAHTAHLGGMVFGYALLKMGGSHPLGELKYRYFKWKMNRHRRRFDVYTGGRSNDWDRKIH